MRQSALSLLVVALVLVVVSSPASARPRPRPRPRRFVAVPLEHVQLIREVRHAPPPPPPPPPPPSPPRTLSGHHYHHRNHRQATPDAIPEAAPEAQAPYEDPEPQASSYEAEGAYDHDGYGSYAPEPDQPRNRFERQSGGGGGDDHEYVDYGAHTGHHGAFGWYADFPVVSKGHRR